MPDGPQLYHPARSSGATYAVDTTVTVAGYQLRPDTWAGLAAWCGGDRTLDDAGNQALQVGSATAHLGDFVMRRDGVFRVEPADGHYQRWAPATETGA